MPAKVTVPVKTAPKVVVPEKKKEEPIHGKRTSALRSSLSVEPKKQALATPAPSSNKRSDKGLRKEEEKNVKEIAKSKPSPAASEQKKQAIKKVAPVKTEVIPAKSIISNDSKGNSADIKKVVQPVAPKKASTEKSKKEIAKKPSPPAKQPETAKKVLPAAAKPAPKQAGNKRTGSSVTKLENKVI